MAQLFDTAIVIIFKMIGGLPNQKVDTYLGEDTTIDDVAGSGYWQTSITLPEGKHSIYSVAYDVAGNESLKSQKEIIVLPSPFRVSSGSDWTIGEIGSVSIGACN